MSLLPRIASIGGLRAGPLTSGSIGSTVQGYSDELEGIAQNGLAKPRAGLLSCWRTAIAERRRDYEDGAVWTESWTNLSSWGAVGVAVSGGRLYSTSDNPAGANRTFSVASGESARIISSLVVPAATADPTTLTFFGVSSTTAGVAPSAGDSGAIGIGVGMASSAYTFQAFGLSGSGAAVVPGTYSVEVSIDPVWITFAMVGTTHTAEYLTRISRASFPTINNVHLWNNDSRGVSGVTIGPAGARKNAASITPRTGIEGIADFVTRTDDGSGQNIRIWVPKAYDSRVPSPLIAFAHGSGWDENYPWTGQVSINPERAFFQALVDAGYIVASSNQHGANWGNSAGMADLKRLIEWTQGRYAISDVSLMGGSMGGVSSLNVIAEGLVPVSAWVGLYPVTNLASMYASFTAQIDTAYSISGGNYSTQTDGHDPALASAASFAGVPMLIFASASDAVVIKEDNADAFAAAVAGYVPEVTVTAVTGAHGSAAHYDATAVIDFLAQSRGSLA